MPFTVLSLLPFPPLAWWRAALEAPAGLLDAGEPFRKMGLRNRYRLASSNGPLWLTVPIVGGREQRTPVGQITINNRLPWQRNHWRSLGSIYRRTPFFEHYEPLLHPLFHTPYDSLAAFNADSIAWCRTALGIATKLEPATAISFANINDQREYRIGWSAFPQQPYNQPFLERTGFLAGMSVLDALFNEGPATAALLR